MRSVTVHKRDTKSASHNSEFPQPAQQHDCDMEDRRRHAQLTKPDTTADPNRLGHLQLATQRSLASSVTFAHIIPQYSQGGRLW